MFSVFCVSIFDFYDDVKKGITILSKVSSGHNLDAIINNFGFLFLQIVATSGFILLVFFIIDFESNLKFKFFTIVLVALLTFFFFNSFYDYLLKYPKGNSFPFLFFVLVFILKKSKHYFINKNQFIFNSSHLICLLLFVLPFIGAFGTDNPFLSNSTFMISSWFAIVLLVIDKSSTNQLFVNAVYVVLITVSSYLFVNQYVQNPYRINSLQSQTESIPNERVKLDVESANFISKVEAILKKNNFKKGDPIVGLYKMPGLVYLLGGKSPGGIISLWDQNRTNQFLAELKESSIDYSTSYFLIKNRYSDSLVIGLNTLGVKFPNDYVNVGNVSMPVNVHNGGVCYVYAHKSKVDANLEIIKEQLQKALAYLNSGDFNQSIQWYEKVLANDSSNTTALNNMGLAYMRLKKYENAVSCFKKAIELEPSFQLAKNNLNWAIIELNNQ